MFGFTANKGVMIMRTWVIRLDCGENVTLDALDVQQVGDYVAYIDGKYRLEFTCKIAGIVRDR
jgi:hypothetical protein